MSRENKRIGRESELRKKVKDAMQRHVDVFGKELTVEGLREFLDESEKQNRLTFLRDRIGMLSDLDVKFIRDVLKGSKGANIAVVDTESLDELDEISDDDELRELSA